MGKHHFHVPPTIDQVLIVKKKTNRNQIATKMNPSGAVLESGVRSGQNYPVPVKWVMPFPKLLLLLFICRSECKFAVDVLPVTPFVMINF